MSLRNLHEAHGLVYRDSGSIGVPVLMYLPGVHGCWTPLARARCALESRFRLIEIAYPPKPEWQLEDFAEGVLEVLQALSLESAHLVGESFGSLVAWQIGLARPERVRSHLLLGGFCRAPRWYRAALARAALRVVPTHLFGHVVDRYVDFRAVTVMHEDDALVGAYPAVRHTPGRLATAQRMHLIQQTDLRKQLSGFRCPVRYLGGAKDTVVPVAREIETLSRCLPASCGFESRLIADAPHMIIATHPDLVVDQLERWIAAIER